MDYLERLQTIVVAGIILVGYSSLLRNRFLQCFLPSSQIFPWSKALRRFHIAMDISHPPRDATNDTMCKLYKQYGRVVRIGPNRVVFADAAAWRDVHTHKTKDGQQNKKDSAKFQPFNNIVTTLDDDLHMRYRRIFSPAFSSRAIVAQEPLITRYVDLLVSGLKEKCSQGPQQMTSWFNWTTFDIIGDLTFGESFGCLESKTDHPWVTNFFAHTKIGLLSSHLRENFRLFRWIEPYLHSTSSYKKRAVHAEFTKSKVQSRWDQGETGRPDFMTLVWKEDGKEAPLSKEETFANAVPIVIAGSETTATTLSGALFLLCRNPSTYKTLTTTLRQTFTTPGSITFTSIAEVPYLTAVLRETLRLYPPVPTEGERRIVEPAGQLVAGYWVPQGTYCGVSAFAANRYEACWTQPNDFIPERWLGEDSKYENDERDLAQPFSAGPRNCIGQNLAWMELKLVLAKIMVNSDFELVDKEQDWIGNQKTYLMWEKLPLWMHVRPVGPAAR